MDRKKFILMAAIGLLAGLTGGCAGLLLAGGAAAGAGTYVYMNGELSDTLNASIETTWEATKTAVDKMGLVTQDVSHDALTGRLYAKNVNGKDIYINLKSLTENHTEVRIRVGIMGDEYLSERVLTYIRKQLPVAPKY